MRTENGNPGVEIEILLGESVEAHTHRDLELLYVMEGTLRLNEENQRLELTAGDIVMLNSGRRHAFTVSKGALICCLQLSYRLLSEYTGRNLLLFWCNSMHDSDNSYEELRGILQELLLDFGNGRREQYFQRYSLYYKLLHFVVNHFLIDNAEIHNKTRKEKTDERLSEIVGFIESNYYRDISLQELSERFFLSNAYLSKHLKDKLGVNFIEYVNAVRLHYAVEDLLYSGKSITQVALDNGFASLATFNRLFKEKHSETPSAFRAKTRNAGNPEERKGQSDQARHRLRQHFGVAVKTAPESDAEMVRITVDGTLGQEYNPVWRDTINAGAAKMLLRSDMQQALILAKKELGIRYVRFWSIFAEDMYTVAPNAEAINFGKVAFIIDFLLANDMKPFIELGEKPERIIRNLEDAVLFAVNKTLFQRYDEFLAILEKLMAHLASHYGEEEMASWRIELWDDRRVEVYRDKRTYAQLFRDVHHIVRTYAPKVKFGGAGTHLGWYKDDTELSVRRWIDEGLYPDFISFDYYPYAAIDAMAEKSSKRKMNPNDFAETLDDLKRTLFEYGFPERETYITDFNSSVSQRSCFHDSCWKAAYLLKNYIDTLGKADCIAYSQISDITADYVDVTDILSGMGGLITRDGIRKPAWYAMLFLRKLKPLLVSRGDHFIITRDKSWRFTVAMHNFKAHNYLYYLKKENETTLSDHYRYFENMEDKHIDLELRGMPDGRYMLRRSTLNRKHGSLMDEWLQMGCFSKLRGEDIDYLKSICIPKVTLQIIEVKHGAVTLPSYLRPLEISLLEITPIR